MTKIDNLLAGDGIHQIANLTKEEWAYIKRGVRKGLVLVVPDYGFPRVTKRYIAAA
jgi:hypothetical protein